MVKAGEGQPGYLNETQFSRLRQQLDEQFAGAANAGRPLLLEGGLEWKEMSLSPRDMDFVQIKHSSARDVALAFGVPPQLLGIPGDNTYANLAEARLALWEQTILPMLESVTDALNNWLAPMFEGTLELKPDTDAIPALAAKRDAYWERIAKADFLSAQTYVAGHWSHCMIEDKNEKKAAPEFSGALEIKKLDAEGRFAGYASVFDVVDSQRDRMRPGAFRTSLKTRSTPVKLLWQHQWENPIGVIDNIFEDARGLFVQGRLLMEVAKAREAYALLKAGALRGMSIGYQVKRSRRDPDSGVRELLEVELWEVSIVTLPANTQANVTVVKGAEPFSEMRGLIVALSQAAQTLSY